MDSNNTQAAGANNPQAWGKSPWRAIIWTAAGLLLLVPLLAMQLTREVSWDLADFAIFGGMLAAACGSFEVAARLTRNRAYRGGVAVALATAFFLIWVNLAVGIIGNEGNPANLMYWGVLAVALGGALAARFRAKGMARALVATAVAQATACLIAVVSGWGYTLVLTGVFVGLWLLAAHLFGKAAREQARRPA
jgi:GNAT superfamily N-acetyltransferase